MSSPRWRAWQSGTGTSANALVINILDYDESGGTDYAAALASAYAALPTTGGIIFFPAGRYPFSAKVTLTYPSSDAIFDLKLIGAGQNASTLYWADSDGIEVVFNSQANACHQSINVDSMTFATDAAATRKALYVRDAASHSGSYAALNAFANLEFRADGGYGATDGWATCVDLLGISNVNFYNCLFEGPGASPATAGTTGIKFSGQSSSVFAVVMNAQGCTFNNLANGFLTGPYTQGLTFEQCNWAGCSNCYYVPAGTATVSGSAIAQLCFSNCQFGLFTSSTFAIVAGSNAPISQFMCVNNLFLLVASSSAGIVAPLLDCAIVGNVFQAGTVSGTTGISVTSTQLASAMAISGNTFISLGSGITLQSGCYHVGIGANAYYGNTLNVTNGAVAGHGNVCTLYGAQDQGYTHYMGNEGGGAGDHGVFIFAGATAASDSSTVLIGFGNGNRTSVVGSVTRSGTGVAYNTTSDAALKEDFGAVKEDSLGALRALKVQSFRWKDGGGEVPAGLVAQHVHEVLPRYVREGSDPKSDPWTIDSSLNPTLVRAIQQLAEESEALREKIISLEGLLRAKDEK